MSDADKKLLLAFLKGLIPLVSSLIGGLISVHLGGAAVSVAIGSVVGGIAYSAC